jgi:hypothetical protein
MAVFTIYLWMPKIRSDPMMLGSAMSPKPGINAQFSLGDLPVPVSLQPQLIGDPSVGMEEMRSLLLAGELLPNQLCQFRKVKVELHQLETYDVISSAEYDLTTLTSRKQANVSVMLYIDSCIEKRNYGR